MWTSTTRVTWLNADARDEVWRSVCTGPKKRKWAWKPKGNVCCYGLQGLCKYGRSCGCSHDFKLGRDVGCQFGINCTYGHSAIALAREADYSETEDYGSDSIPCLDKGVLQNARRTRAQEGAYLQCKGLAFDGSDPLWEEVCIALLDGNEELGDADLPNSARYRLAADGCYRLVDEETSDEWLCLPGDILQQRLEQSEARFATIRRDWLVDDLIDARVFWDQLLTVLTRRRKCRSEPEQESIFPDEADDDLQKAGEKMDVELRKAIELGPKLLPMPIAGRAADNSIATLTDEVTSSFVEAVNAAFLAAEELQSLCSSILQRRRERHAEEMRTCNIVDDGKNKDEEMSQADVIDAGSLKASRGDDPEKFGCPIRLCNPLDDEIWRDASDVADLHSFRLTQLRRCLRRCVYVCRCIQEESQFSLTSSFVPSVGVEAEIVGLTASAECKLNGHSGLIEAFHANHGLWQICLSSSGTRLLLPPSQLTKPSKSGTRTTRSRSPRAQRGDASPQVSLLNLVRKAAARGDHILLHHVVK